MKWLKKWLPTEFKNAIKLKVREYHLRHAIAKISRGPIAKIPDKEVLKELCVGWGNPEYAANIAYMEEVARLAIETKGPILECGSGATTILLGLIAGRRGVEVWSFEDGVEWHNRVTEALAKNRISGVEVQLTRLRDFNGFCWYDAPLSNMPRDFSLVICDGPPGNTPGGRYGLLPVLRDHLQNGATILLDDAHRPGEKKVVNQWIAEGRVSAQATHLSDETFALLEFVAAN
jgi:hypothetical protein